VPTEPVTASLLPAAPVRAATPAGFISFCLRFADQCTAHRNEPGRIVLDMHNWQLLQAVNHNVNDSMWPETDQAHYGRAEYWTIPTDGYGDCEDYALTKRKQLSDLGLPSAALRLAVVYSPQSLTHAVLTVATDRGDFVLDNLSGDIRPWNALHYTWIEVQDAEDPMAWNRVGALTYAMDKGQITGSQK